MQQASTSALQEVLIPIDLGIGIDTKTDPKLILKTRLSRLENAVINQIGQITKRPGTQSLPNIDTTGTPITSGQSLGVLDNELLMLGQGNIYGFGEANGLNFSNKGELTTVGVNRRILQSNLANLQSVNAASANGVTVYAWDSRVSTSLSWMVVDEASQTIYQSGTSSASQTPQIVVVGSVITLIYGTAAGTVVSRSFNTLQPYETLIPVVLTGITLSGTMVLGAATVIAPDANAGQWIAVAGANNVGGITVASYDPASLGTPLYTTTLTPGYAPPFISVTQIQSFFVGLAYPDLIGNLKVSFHASNFVSIFGPYTVLALGASHPIGPACMRPSPTNGDAVYIYATVFNPQGNSQIMSPCGQSVQAFSVSISTGGRYAPLFTGDLLVNGAQLASFPWYTGVGTTANILVQYQVDPSITWNNPSTVAPPQSAQPTTFVLDADTGVMVGRGPPGEALVAGASLSGVASYPVLPNANLIGTWPGYLIPDTSDTVFHISGSDLAAGTAKIGNPLVASGVIPFNKSDTPMGSVGPFSVPPFSIQNYYTLPIGSPLAFGNEDFSGTLILSSENWTLFNQNQPLSTHSGADPNGFWIQTDGDAIAFGLGDSYIEDLFTYHLGQVYVVSFGYQASTSTIYLKVNDRPIITGAVTSGTGAPTTTGTLGSFPADNPFDGNIFELWASTDTPSDEFFTSRYNAVSENMPKRLMIGAGASLILESQGSEFVFSQGIGELLLDYGLTRPLFLETLKSNSHITGGQLDRYDGQTIAEHGFALNPEFLQANSLATVTGEVCSLIDVQFTFSTPGFLTGQSITTLAFPPGSQMYPGEWWAIDDSGVILGNGAPIPAVPGKYYWYSINGQGSDPAPGGLLSVGHMVSILTTDTSRQVAQKTLAVVNGTVSSQTAANVAVVNGISVLEIQLFFGGAIVSGTATGMSPIPSLQSGKFRVAETVPALNGGTSTTSRCYSIACCPAAFITPGQYWQMNAGGAGAGGGFSDLVYVWYKVNSVGTDPKPAPIFGGTGGGVARTIGVEVDILASDSAATVASKTLTALSSNATLSPLMLGTTVVPGGVGTTPPCEASGNFIFLSWLTNSASGQPDSLVPEIGANISVGAGALGLGGANGAVNTSSYQYTGVYAEVDGRGNIHRSAPSSGLTVVCPRSPLTDSRVTVTFPYLHLTNKGSQVILELYRSAANGTTPYKITPSLTPVANNPALLSTTIPDSLQDVRTPGDTISPELITNEILYTDGGNLQHDVMAPAAVAHVHRGRVWLGGFADDRQRLQASLLEPQGRGVAFSDDTSHTIELTPDGGDFVTFGTLNEKLILFKQRQIYWTAGDGPDATGQNGAFLVPELINAELGCNAPKSVVRTPLGLIFKSEKGWFLLDLNLTVTHLEAPDGYNGYSVTSGVVDDASEQARWTTLNGPTICYNYARDAWSINDNAGALDSIVYAPQTPGQTTTAVYYYLTADGKVHQETPGIYLDDGVGYALLMQTAWIKPGDQVAGFARARKTLWLGLWPALQESTLTIEYNDNEVGGPPATTGLMNLTVSSGSGGFWGDGASWGSDPSWGGPALTGNDIVRWRAFVTSQKATAFRFTLQDIYPFLSTRAVQIANLTLAAAIKKGAAKLGPTTQSIGS